MPVPQEPAIALDLRAGDRVDIEAHDDRITIRPSRSKDRLRDLFAGKPADEWRFLYREAYDRGPDRGRETVEE